MAASSTQYAEYASRMKKIADVRYASAVLQWDQETYLPPKGAAARSRQLATLNELAHQLFTDKDFGTLLQQLKGAALSPVEQKNVELTWEDYEKQQKFSSAFIRQMSEAVSAAFYAWIESRKQNDFKIYEPALTKLIGLKIQEAELLGYKGHRYDALLDQFEKGATVSLLDKVFDTVLSPLRQLMSEIRSRPQVDASFLQQHYSKTKQWEWGMYLVKELGFDLAAGRQDISEHPFTTNFSASDVRITTRIDEQDFANMTWSCIHEVGHALYEQGLPDEYYGLPAGEYASLGIHESQSRLWENCLGRGKPFWRYYLPILKGYFPEQLSAVEVDQFVAAINKVEPSLIRTEADELSYHFHVFIRYSLEKELITGSVPAKDIPAYWNELYKNHLGVTVPDDLNGCLQDVHWSHGSFGYFPTYSLGSFYAAQFWTQVKQEVPGIEQRIEAGQTAGLLAWLREKVHAHGKMYTSEELCKKITGRGLDSSLFLDYLREKFLN